MKMRLLTALSEIQLFVERGAVLINKCDKSHILQNKSITYATQIFFWGGGGVKAPGILFLDWRCLFSSRWMLNNPKRRSFSF